MENVELLRTFGSLSLFLAAGSILFVLLRNTRTTWPRPAALRAFLNRLAPRAAARALPINSRRLRRRTRQDGWFLRCVAPCPAALALQMSKTRIPYGQILLGLVLMLPVLGRAQTAAVPPGYTSCALDANGVCAFSGPAELAYACVGPATATCPSGTFIFRRFQGPNIACNGQSFGLAVSLQGAAYNKCFIPAEPPVAVPVGYNLCATEGGGCKLGNSTDVVVAFGANGSFVSRRLNTDPSSTQATWLCKAATFFNVDPAFGVVKSCFISALSSLIPYGYTKCADEHFQCNFTGPARVLFGANGNLVFSDATNGTFCETGSFNGVDPAPGTVKSCYISADPPGYSKCADENSQCSFSGTATVAFGAAGRFTYMTLLGGTSCSDAAFGDPAFGVVKSCYLPAGPGGFQFCSSENSTCQVPATGPYPAFVYYGFNGSFAVRSFLSPSAFSVPCDGPQFGSEPYPGTNSCFIIGQYFQ